MRPSKSKDFFKKFVQENDLTQTGHLNEIRSIDKQQVIGIDAGLIARELRDTVKMTEPLWLLQGPVPFSVKSFLKSYVKRFADVGVKPVVVFDGMTLQQLYPNHSSINSFTFGGQWKALVNQELSIKDLSNEQRQSLEKEISAQPFGDEVYSVMANTLRDLGVEVWTAPFWAWSQMAAFMNESNKCIGEVHGPLELLMFRGVDRVIVSIDTANGKFRFVEKAKVLEKLSSVVKMEVTADDFTHALIVDSSHPLLHEDAVTYGNFQSFAQILSELLPGEPKGIVKKIATMEEGIKFPFFRARAGVECSPVLHYTGDCVPLSKLSKAKATTYSALRDIFGFPVPPLYYYFLASGVLNRSVLSTVTSQRIIDHSPVAETREFQQAAECIIPLRTQIVYQLIQLLSIPENHNFYQSSNTYQLVWYRTYLRSQQANNPIPILRPPPIKLDEWVALPHNKREPVSFYSVLDFAENARPTGNYPSAHSSLAAVHLKALDLLGYFTHATHANSHEVSGPSIYSDALKKCAPALSAYGVLLIELIRTKNLTDDPLHLTATRDAQDTTPGAGIHFATRLACMIPIALKSAWTGPVNVSLLGYNAMLNALHHTLRSLVEVIAVTLFFGDNVSERPPNQFEVPEYITLAEQLPFREPPSIHGGIIMHHILCDPDFGESTSPQSAWANLAYTFPDVEDMKRDVKNLCDMWSSACRIVDELYKEDTAGYGKINGVIQNVANTVASRMDLLGLSTM